MLEVRILGSHTRPTESKTLKAGTAISVLEISPAYSYTRQNLRTILIEYRVLHDVFQPSLHIRIP